MVAFTAVDASHRSRSQTMLSALELAAKLRGANYPPNGISE